MNVYDNIQVDDVLTRYLRRTQFVPFENKHIKLLTFSWKKTHSSTKYDLEMS